MSLTNRSGVHQLASYLTVQDVAKYRQVNRLTDTYYQFSSSRECRQQSDNFMRCPQRDVPCHHLCQSVQYMRKQRMRHLFYSCGTYNFIGDGIEITIKSRYIEVELKLTRTGEHHVSQNVTARLRNTLHLPNNVDKIDVQLVNDLRQLFTLVENMGIHVRATRVFATQMHMNTTTGVRVAVQVPNDTSGMTDVDHILALVLHRSDLDMGDLHDDFPADVMVFPDGFRDLTRFTQGVGFQQWLQANRASSIFRVNIRISGVQDVDFCMMSWQNKY
jgi:hypothetical protein